MKMNKQKWIILIAALLIVLLVVNMASLVYNHTSGIEQGTIKRTKYNPLAIELNNKAMALWQKEVLKRKPDYNVAQQVTKLLDSSIALDSSYYLASGNKVNILSGFGHKLEAIETLERCVGKVPSFAEGIDLLGMFYESLGRKEEALINYRKAVSIFEKRLKEKHSFNDRGNEILVLLKSGRKAEADSLVGELPHEFPDKKKEIASFLGIYTNYNHDEMIKSICGRQYN